MSKKQLNYSDLANKAINKINPVTNLPTGTSITNKTSNIIDPSPVKTTLDYAGLRNKSKTRSSSLLKPIKAPGIDLKDYKLVPEVRLHQGQETIDRIRANNQRWYKQLGNFVGQALLGEVVGGAVMGFGALAELPSFIIDSAQGKSADFDNVLMSLGNDLNEWTKEKMPIYQVAPNKSWQMDDFGWWMGNGVSIASTLSLMIPGMAVVRGVGWLGKAIKVADKIGDTTKYFSKLAIGAGTMRHGENMRESFQVANDARKLALDQFNKPGNYEDFINSEHGKDFINFTGADPDDPNSKKLAADYIAAKAGWRSYRVNSINIVFDALQIAPMFRGFKVGTRNTFGTASKVAKAQRTALGKPDPGRLSRAWSWSKSTLNPVVSATGRQLTEGIEEGINFIGGEEGTYKAEKILGLENSKFSSRFGEYIKDGHLWESAFWGVLGGIAFEGGIGLTQRWTGSNKNGPHSVPGKIAEIQQRKAFITQATNKLRAIQNADPSYTDITGEYNFQNITEEQRQDLIAEVKRDMAYNLGLNAAVTGNIDLLLEQLEDTKFQESLIESGVVEKEGIDQFIDDIKEDVLEAEDVYKKHVSRFIMSSATGAAKNLLINKSVDLDLQKSKINKTKQKLEERNTELKLKDTTYTKSEGNMDLAVRKAALQLSKAQMMIEMARADGLKFKSEEAKTEAINRYKKIIENIDSKLNEIDSQVKESGEKLPSVQGVDERIIDNQAAIEGYDIAEDVISGDIASLKTKKEAERAEKEIKEQAERSKELQVKLAEEAIKDSSLGLTDNSSAVEIREAIEKLKETEKGFRDKGMEEPADILSKKIKELEDRIGSGEKKNEVKRSKKETKGDQADPPNPNETEAEKLERLERQGLLPNQTDKDIDDMNPTVEDSITEDNTEQQTQDETVEVISETENNPIEFPDPISIGETEIFTFIGSLIYNRDLSTKGVVQVSDAIVKALKAIMDLKVGDKLQVIAVNKNDIELRDSKGNVIGYLNSVRGKEALLKKAKNALKTAENKEEKEYHARRVKSIETEIATIKSIRESLDQLWTDGVIKEGDRVGEMEVTDKLRGQLITNEVEGAKQFRGINQAFGKKISLYMNQKETVRQLEPIYDADGNAVPVFVGSGISAPMFGPGVIYTLVQDDTGGPPMAVPLSTANVDARHAEFVWEALLELANRMNKRADGKYINDLRNKEIKDLKDLINEITLTGSTMGIKIHNEKIEIPMPDGNVLQLYFREKGQGNMKGAPVKGGFNLRILTADEASGKVDKVKGNFVYGAKSMADIKTLTLAALTNLKRQVNKKNFTKKGKYKSPLTANLKSPILENTGQEYDSYYDYLTQEQTDDGLPVLRTDVGAVINEKNNVISHFVDTRVRMSNFKFLAGISPSGPGRGKVDEELPGGPGAQEIQRKAMERLAEEEEAPPDVTAKDVSEGLKESLGEQFLNKEDIKGMNIDPFDDAFDKLSRRDLDELNDNLDRAVTERDITEGYDKEDVDRAEKWFKKNLPHVPFSVVDGLIKEGPTAFGRFHNAAVSLSNIAKEGTAYHEAFHAVFHMYLNPVQRQELLKEAKERYGIEYMDLSTNSALRNKALFALLREKLPGYDANTLKKLITKRVIPPDVYTTPGNIDENTGIFLFMNKKEYAAKKKDTEDAIARMDQNAIQLDKLYSDLLLGIPLVDRTKEAIMKIAERLSDYSSEWNYFINMAKEITGSEGLLEFMAEAKDQLNKELNNIYDRSANLESELNLLNEFEQLVKNKELDEISIGIKASEIVLEEKLADEFMTYMQTGVEDTSWTGRIKQFFKDLLQYFKNLLGIGSAIDRLFYDIKTAKFTYKPDEAAVNHAKKVVMNRDVEGERVPDNNIPSEGFTDAEERALLNKLPALYYMVKQKMNAKAVAEANRTGERVKQPALDDIKAGVISLLSARSKIVDNVTHQRNLLRTIQALNKSDSDLWNKTIGIVARDYQVTSNSLVQGLEDAILNDELEGMNSDDLAEIKRNWDDGTTMGTDQKTRATGEVRSVVRMTQSIEDIVINKDGTVQYITEKDDFLGLTNFLDFDKVYPYLAANLAGIQNGEQLLLRLEELSKFDVSLLKLKNQIDPGYLTPREQELSTTEKQVIKEKKKILLAKFTVTFAKQTPTMDVDLVSERGKTTVHKPSRANNNDTKVILTTKWISNILTKHRNKEVDVKALANDIKKIASQIYIANQLDDAGLKKLSQDISKTFEKLGINLMEGTTNKMSEAIFNALSNPVFLIRHKTVGGILQNVFLSPLAWAADNLAKKDVVFDQVGSLRALAQAVRFFKYDIIQNTSLNVENKTQYTVSDSNFMSDFFARWKSDNPSERFALADDIDILLDMPSMKHSNWLKLMVRYNEDGSIMRMDDGTPILNDEFFELFDYSYEDGLKNTDNNKGIKYTNMEDADWYYLNLAKFINGLGRTAAENWSKFPQPIPSDSSNIIYITAPRYKGQFIYEKKKAEEEGQEDTEVSTNILRTDSGLSKALLNLVKQEVHAMHQAQLLLFEFDSEGNIKLDEFGKPIIKEDLDYRILQKDVHYKQGPNGEKLILDEDGYPLGEIFKFNSFVGLNNIIGIRSHVSPRTGKGFIKNLGIGNAEIKAINGVIQNTLTDEMLQLQANPVFMAQVSKLWALAKTTYATKEHFIIDFLGNQKISLVESQNWFAGNIAEFKNKQDSTKRAKQTNSPGMKQAGIFTNPMFGVIVIKDLVLPSQDIETIATTLKDDIQKRKNYKGTDAEFNMDNIIAENPQSSLEREVYRIARHYLAINTGDAQGYVSWERYKRQLKDNAMWNDDIALIVKKIDNDEYITPEELNAIMQPLKGFYYNRSIDKNTNRLRSRQLKYSTVPLIPQLIKGTDLEILADKMDAYGIDETVFESASKVGTLSVFKLHDENGRILPDIFEELVMADEFHVELLDNNRWMRQQDVPTKLEQVTGTLGTQIKDLIFTNLSNDSIYKVAFSEISFTGKELLQKNLAIAAANIEEDAMNLLMEIGAEIVEDSTAVGGIRVIFKNNKKVRALLIRELTKRGLNDNYIKAILPKPGTDEFNLPLFFSGMASKFESVLLSLFTNNVTNQKFPGFTSVQFSGAFFRTGKKASESVQALNEERMQGVEYIDGHDASQRLRTTRDSESGIITAEVIVSRPNMFNRPDGTPIPINEIDPEVLEMIGYRIPTEAKHSMVVFKVVGFTPAATGDIIILPDDIIAQTGSDFDIDKMQVMVYTSENGKKIHYDDDKSPSENSRDQRNNGLLDTFMSVLKNRYHLSEMLDTGNFDDLKEIREEMDNIDNIKEETFDISSFSGQDEMRKRNISGRILKGISATFNKFGAIAQNTKMVLSEPFIWKYRLTEIDEASGIEIKRNVEDFKARYGEENVRVEGEFIIVTHELIGWTRDNTHLNANGDLVLKHSAQGITGAVDISSDPTFSSFNVKAFTYPMVAAATLVGIPWKDIAWLTKQQIVKEVQDKYYEARGILGDNTPVHQIIRDIRNSFLNVSTNPTYQGKLFALLSDEKQKQILTLLNRAKKGDISWSDYFNKRAEIIGISEEVVPLSKNELKDLYLTSKNFDNLTKEEKIEYYKKQLQVLNNFEYFRKIGSAVSSTVSITKADTIGAGPQMTVTSNFERQLDSHFDNDGSIQVELENGELIDAALALHPSYFGRDAESVYPTLDTVYRFSNQLSIKSVGQHFIEQHPSFRMILDGVMETLRGDRFFKYDDRIEAIVRNWVVSYLLKDADIFSDLSDSDKRDILGITSKEDRNITSLAEDIASIQKRFPSLAQSDGHILAFLNPKLSEKDKKNNNGIEFIEVNEIPKDTVIQNHISRSLLRMYRGTALDADGRSLPEDVREELQRIAKKILQYEFITRGLNFGRNSLTEVIDTNIKLDEQLGAHLERKLQSFNMGNDPMKTGEENLNELIHKIIRANWFRHDMVPRVKRKTTKVLRWDKKTRQYQGKVETVRGTGNWVPNRDGIIVTEGRKKLDKEPPNVRNSQYVYVPIYKKITRGKNKGNWVLVSDVLYMQYGEDPSTGKLYWIPVSRTSLPGKLMEFGTKSILDTNDPYREAFPFSNEQEAMDYIDGVLNGDIDRQQVLDEIEDTQQASKQGYGITVSEAQKRAIEMMEDGDPDKMKKLMAAFEKMSQGGKDRTDKIMKAIEKADEKDTNAPKVKQIKADPSFKIHSKSGYAARTAENTKSHATIDFSFDPNVGSGGVRGTTKINVDRFKREYIGIRLESDGTIQITDELVKDIVNQLNNANKGKGAVTVNIAGHGIAKMAKQGATQKQLDDSVYKLVKQILAHPDLKNKNIKINTGGQTGFDEAGTKAAMRLGIENTILAPRGWMFRDKENNDISDEHEFKARFGIEALASTVKEKKKTRSMQQEVGLTKVDSFHKFITEEGFVKVPLKNSQKMKYDVKGWEGIEFFIETEGNKTSGIVTVSEAITGARAVSVEYGKDKKSKTAKEAISEARNQMKETAKKVSFDKFKATIEKHIKDYGLNPAYRKQVKSDPSKTENPTMDKMLKLFEQQQVEKKKNDDNSETKCD
ncbi:MAG: hypothetical protein GOVbin1709_76 [Prokaryotic dsDNA virus sp.]|nr:MAG: hypothetical protein GOVbin1709_76 [Prokaryotic dsDNA virus sp.]|tara:strand:- start:25261 stop:38847 length:13587 start_codon:yes stop_codon:yes gene_type:complete